MDHSDILTSPQDASAGVRLMMTAVRSSCCAVPSANPSTTAWSQEMISTAGNSPCWIDRAMLRSCSIHPARFRRRNAYRAKAGQTSAARTCPPPASRISSCPACTRSARSKRAPGCWQAGLPAIPPRRTSHRRWSVNSRLALSGVHPDHMRCLLMKAADLLTATSVSGSGSC